MTISHLIELYTQDQRVNNSHPESERQVLPNLIRHVSQVAGEEGTIIYSRLDAATADRTIRAQIEWFSARGQSFEWKAYDYDAPPDLVARLAAQGFVIEESEAVMVLDLAQVPAFLLQSPAHAVRRITTPNEVRHVRAIEEAVWGDGFQWLEASLSSALQNRPDQLSIYVAYAGEVAASAGWITYRPGSRFASLWGGSTRSEYRGQGLYTALLAARIQETLQRDVDYLTVDASAMSQPILEKFGFIKIAETFPCKWEAA